MHVGNITSSPSPTATNKDTSQHSKSIGSHKERPAWRFSIDYVIAAAWLVFVWRVTTGTYTIILFVTNDILINSHHTTAVWCSCGVVLGQCNSCIHSFSAWNCSNLILSSPSLIVHDTWLYIYYYISGCSKDNILRSIYNHIPFIYTHTLILTRYSDTHAHTDQIKLRFTITIMLKLFNEYASTSDVSEPKSELSLFYIVYDWKSIDLKWHSAIITRNKKYNLSFLFSLFSYLLFAFYKI